MESKRSRKGRKQRNAAHHPWDEVSLPGAGTGSNEQPTILVINQVNGETTSKEVTLNTDNSSSSSNKTHDTAQTHHDQTDSASADAQIKPEILIKSPAPPTPPTPPHDDHSNVLHIESHLIEDEHTRDAPAGSIGIDEVVPIDDELTLGSSKVETDTNVRSIIEVEPAGVRTKQAIATPVAAKQQTAAVEQQNPDDENEAATKTGNAATRDEATNAEIAATVTKAHEAKAKTESTVEGESAAELDAALIRSTAEDLVNEIETRVIETLSKQAHDVANCGSSTPQVKTEQEPQREELQCEALSEKVDSRLSELTSILKSKPQVELKLPEETAAGEATVKVASNELKIVEVPTPKTALEEEQRKSFIDSLPQIEQTNAAETDAQRLSADCKREYYQSLKKYLLHSQQDKPPVPLQTYRWEDLKRAKERGGYPWTHLYKRPLGPDEEPEIVLLLRKSQELRFKSESPKSLKKVRYDEQVLVKETERYIQDLTDDEDVDVTEDENEEAYDEEEHEHDPELAKHKDTENPSLHSESISCVSDSVLAVGHSKPRRTFRLTHIRNIIKRRRSGRTQEDAQSLPGNSANASRQSSVHDLAPPPGPLIPQIVKTPAQKKPHCFPMMKKLRSLADRQKKRLNIKRIALKKEEKIVLGDEPKILRLKSSPKCDRGEIPHFIEKQDSDDILEIVEYDESPSRKRNKAARNDDEEPTTSSSNAVVQPDEIIELSAASVEKEEELASEPAAVVVSEEEKVSTAEPQQTEDAAPPRKTPRLRREHVYEEIGPGQVLPTVSEPLTDVLPISNVDALKKSLIRQDNVALHDIEAANQTIPLDRMGSSEEEQVAAAAAASAAAETQKANSLLAPISSIDSTSSEEERTRLAQLSTVAEESDATSTGEPESHPPASAPAPAAASVQNSDSNVNEQLELKPSIKKEPSPAPSDKKVTFSHVEDEAEPHREDIELPEDVREAAAEAAGAKNKWRHLSDHEYEPIGVPPKTTLAREASPRPEVAAVKNGESRLTTDLEKLRNKMEAEVVGAQNAELKDRDISFAGATPHIDSRTDYEIQTSQGEELPLKPEYRKKGFMASAQDRTRRMQDGLRNQAGKIRTKLRTQPKKTSPSGSPKAKERRRFKAPEFSKFKMPEIKKPDMSKFKEIKRPEFTKFNKPDMSRFKLPEKFPTLKLRRSKSFKENEAGVADDEESSPVTTETPKTADPANTPKKMFEFNFGTYPRAFRKKKQTPVETAESSLGTEGLSIIPSTETQPSMESSSSPQGDRGPGPVRSRWADKFSDVSYNDSEGSRYRRYGSELESFDRESSLERRMRDDLEDTVDTGSEAHDVGILGGVADSKQFAEFDEENRAIHEISNLRSHEFKRRPMVHQDSDLRSEDSKDAEGWTEKEIQKNKLLRKAELDAEASYYKYHVETGNAHGDAQSTASSGKKVVMEEIDDDEFFLRKRGISEDNIQLRQYISEAIREGYEMPNALVNVGQSSQDVEEGEDYGDYDVPPPKPRRLHKSYRPEYEGSHEFQRSDYGDDFSMSQNGSDFLPAGVPKRPLRKGRSRSKYSVDSQDIPMADEGSNVQYFDDDEEYLRPPKLDKEKLDGLNNLNFALSKPTSYTDERFEEDEEVPRPQPPRRQKKRSIRDGASVEKDAFINGFGGRSVSNTFLQPQEDVIVYRTEHEYLVPLATPENYTDKSRSSSRFDEDGRTSRGADSLAMDMQVKPLAYEHRHNKDEDENEDDREIVEDTLEEKYIIDMMENDGYAVVRKEQIPKPTPPARRKKFIRSPGERFATLPMRTKHGSPPPERPPPPQSYTPSEDFSHRSTTSLDAKPNLYLDDDYVEPEALERPESPRNLQSGEVINKMKFRPLPPPPRPPREKRSAKGEHRLDAGDLSPYRYEDSERIATSSTADSYDQNPDFEVEVSTQTDPLPDDFVCEEFEITDDMKVIEPRRAGLKTLEDFLKASAATDAVDSVQQLTEDEQLARGLQRFRDANQRSMSERSRASSQADRSKSASRPQTPSAIVIERRVSTPALTSEDEATVAAALIVRPIIDEDLEDDELRREEEALRREGLLSDSSMQSKSDIEAMSEEEHLKEGLTVLSDYAPSSADLDAAVDKLEQTQLNSEFKPKMYYDEEVTRKLRDDEYEEADDAEEKYSDHYDEDEEEEEEPEDDDDWTAQKLRAFELQAALEKELQEELEKQQQRKSRSRTPEHLRLSSIEEIVTTPEIFSEEEQELIATITAQEYKSDEEIESKQIDEVESQKEQIDEELTNAPITETTVEHIEAYTAEEPAEPPQPPPRRKSTTVIEPPVTASTDEVTKGLTIAEQEPQPVAHVESVLAAQPQTSQLPSRLGELEVERLRVHALQAGQIMVSQLHGHEISSEEFACKSGNLVVQNIELPPGFIEDIVERVRSTEPPRAILLSTETQTSRQPSSSPQPEPPSKPPRQSKTTESTTTTTHQNNLDEGTQTDASVLPLPTPPPVYPSVEYLQSLAPLAFYNLQRSAEAEAQQGTLDRKTPQKCRRRHVQRRRHSGAEEIEHDDLGHETDSEDEHELIERPLSRRSRTRSGTHPPRSPSVGDEPKTVVQAGRQFITACTFELVSIINQLTHYVRGGGGTLEPAQSAELQQRNLPALMVLFIVITFGLLIFLLTGRNVHTHHWDYFNPPGNEGRQT